MSGRTRIAIATGDPAGIGPEISLKAALDPAVRAACNPILVSDPAVIARHAAACGITVDLYTVGRIADAAWLRVLFVVEGLINVAVFVVPILAFRSAYLFAYVFFGMQLLVLVLLATAAIADRRSGRYRDWPHWLGVFIDLAVFVVAIVPQIAGLISLTL